MKRKLFYPKLALINIKNNSKTYIPYILTCIGTILMFYNMSALCYNSASGDGSLKAMMIIGTIIVGIFSSIFIFYTNSFLVKRRKKEFGLYNVLGMEKKHISKIMLWENTIIGFLSLVLGIGLGIVFSKLVTLLLYKLLNFDPYYQFEISPKSVIITLVLFLGVFILTLISSVIQVYKSKPVELLHGSDVGEKQPKSNWFLTIVGLLALGGGYYIALTVSNPLSALLLFFVAVFLVIIGTYCLFTAGSVVLLKMMKKNKKYYYKTKHFVSLSSMIYRMKKNAVGLANICIMSTAVLVMISTTISMYVGMEDLMAHRYPQDAYLTAKYSSQTRQDPALLKGNIENILNQDKMSYSDLYGYESLTFSTVRKDNVYEVKGANGYFGSDDLSVLIFITADDYADFGGKTVSLKENEVALVSQRDVKNITICSHQFDVKTTFKDLPSDEYSSWLVDVVYVIVPSTNVIDEMYNAQKQMYGENASDIKYNVSFNFNATDDEVKNYCNNTLNSKITKGDIHYDYAIKQLNIEQFYILYGGLFFLGIFLGFLFMLATVLIIYYKQVIEGFEDKERFKIMQNIGMSKKEVKKSINSQILVVFSLPLIAAIIHIMFAFPILKTLLSMLNLTNVGLFILCTIATIVVFAIVYCIIYFATSKVYFKIVNE